MIREDTLIERHEELAYSYALLCDNYEELHRQYEQLKASIWLIEDELRIAARGADEQGRTDWAIQLWDWADRLEAAVAQRVPQI